MVCAISKGSDQPANTLSLIEAFASRLNILYMTVKLLTEQYQEFLSLTEGCTGSSESTLVKMPHCWKGALTWYGKLTWESAYRRLEFVVLCYLIVWGMTFIFMVHLSFYAILLPIYDAMNDITIIP